MRQTAHFFNLNYIVNSTPNNLTYRLLDYRFLKLNIYSVQYIGQGILVSKSYFSIKFYF